MPAPARPISRILDEIAEVRRHLVEIPPHHGSGIRLELERRLQRLEQELAAVRSRPGTTP